MAKILGGSASRLEMYGLFVAAVILIGGGVSGAIVLSSDSATVPPAVIQSPVETQSGGFPESGQTRFNLSTERRPAPIRLLVELNRKQRSRRVPTLVRPRISESHVSNKRVTNLPPPIQSLDSRTSQSCLALNSRCTARRIQQQLSTPRSWSGTQ
jgi:hypothetical protein